MAGGGTNQLPQNDYPNTVKTLVDRLKESIEAFLQTLRNQQVNQVMISQEQNRDRKQDSPEDSFSKLRSGITKLRKTLGQWNDPRKQLRDDLDSLITELDKLDEEFDRRNRRNSRRVHVNNDRSNVSAIKGPCVLTNENKRLLKEACTSERDLINLQMDYVGDFENLRTEQEALLRQLSSYSGVENRLSDGNLAAGRKPELSDIVAEMGDKNRRQQEAADALKTAIVMLESRLKSKDKEITELRARCSIPQGSVHENLVSQGSLLRGSVRQSSIPQGSVPQFTSDFVGPWASPALETDGVKKQEPDEAPDRNLDLVEMLEVKDMRMELLRDALKSQYEKLQRYLSNKSAGSSDEEMRDIINGLYSHFEMVLKTPEEHFKLLVTLERLASAMPDFGDNREHDVRRKPERTSVTTKGTASTGDRNIPSQSGTFLHAGTPKQPVPATTPASDVYDTGYDTVSIDKSGTPTRPVSAQTATEPAFKVCDTGDDTISIDMSDKRSQPGDSQIVAPNMCWLLILPQFMAPNLFGQPGPQLFAPGMFRQSRPALSDDTTVIYSRGEASEVADMIGNTGSRNVHSQFGRRQVREEPESGSRYHETPRHRGEVPKGRVQLSFRHSQSPATTDSNGYQGDDEGSHGTAASTGRRSQPIAQIASKQLGPSQRDATSTLTPPRTSSFRVTQDSETFYWDKYTDPLFLDAKRYPAPLERHPQPISTSVPHLDTSSDSEGYYCDDFIGKPFTSHAEGIKNSDYLLPPQTAANDPARDFAASHGADNGSYRNMHNITRAVTDSSKTPGSASGTTALGVRRTQPIAPITPGQPEPSQPTATTDLERQQGREDAESEIQKERQEAESESQRGREETESERQQGREEAKSEKQQERVEAESERQRGREETKSERQQGGEEAES